MLRKKHVYWELVLLIGSVLMFRGLWHLMDKVPFMDEPYFLFFSFVVGLVLMATGFYRMAHVH